MQRLYAAAVTRRAAHASWRAPSRLDVSPRGLRSSWWSDWFHARKLRRLPRRFLRKCRDHFGVPLDTDVEKTALLESCH
eukprot:scaffold74600_cov29-Tisochrysis_lutea.AAC.3